MEQKFITVSTRVTDEYYEMIKEDAGLMGMSLSQWFLAAIDEYLDMSNLNCLDLIVKDFEGLEELVEEYDLDVNPDDFSIGLGTTKKGRADDFREAVAQAMDIPISDEDIWYSLCDQDIGELEVTAEFLDIPVDPEDDEDSLREAIADELEIEIPGEEDNPDDEPDPDDDQG